MTASDILPYIIAICMCVLFSGYFSATETAFSSLNKTRLKALSEKGRKRATTTLKLAENYDKLISTILIGNNIVNIAAATIGTLLFVHIFGDIGATVSTIVVTVVVLIFGEITPKSIAKDMPERFAMFATPFLRVLILILTPINFIFSAWKKLVSKVFNIKDDSKMSQEELLLLVDEVEQEGSIDTDEGELLRNAIEFGDMVAEDILTHRVDLEAVPIDAKKDEIAQIFTSSRFTRLPVYEESVDNIVGIIHQKDFYVGTGVTDKEITEIIAPPVFIHKSEKIDDLLKLLQTRKSHIAIVIDEYGGTLGIITMEDILEELVGEIWDEHDEITVDFRKLQENVFLVDGAVNLDDFCDHFDIRVESDSVSLGGWVMEQLDKVPVKGDRFEYENLTITVTETDSHRVVYVRVNVKPKEDESDDE